MNHTILQWTVLPTSTPHILRRCPKCSKIMPFASTDKFRVNAQQKNLDVWLIYACTHCSSTLNMELYARIAPVQLPAELYEQFLSNNQETAIRYAFDQTMLLKNNAVVDYQTVAYEVIGEPFDPTANGNITIEINCHCSFGLRLNQLLGRMLGLSRRELRAMFESNVFYAGKKGEKTKLKEKTILEYCRH